MKLFMLGLLFFTLPVHAAYKFVAEKKVREGVSLYEYKLDNGLSVFITANPKAPTVSVYHWVKAGALNEKAGVTGIAHLFEHMMFRPLRDGAPNFMEKVQQLGGSSNANTRFMATVFTTTVPKERLDDLFKLEADRFQHLTVTDKLLDVERKAVWSEYSTKFDTSPTINLWGGIYQLGFKGHPYGWTITGFREDLEKIKAKDCNEFFQKFYRPNNVGIFVAGDVNPNQVIKSIDSNYASWKAGENATPPAPYTTKTKYLQGTGTIPTNSRQIMLGIRLEDEKQNNGHFLRFINHVLFGSDHSLADRRLKIAQHIVSGISTFNYDYDSGLMTIIALPSGKLATSKFVDEILALKDDMKKMDDIHFEAYKKEYQIELQESILRNEALNEELALNWGKYGGVDSLLKIESIVAGIQKQDVVKEVQKLLHKDKLVVIETKLK